MLVHFNNTIIPTHSYLLTFMKNNMSWSKSSLHCFPCMGILKVAWISLAHGPWTANHDHEKFDIIFPHGPLSRM